MTRLVQFALEHLGAEHEYTALDAAAGDGRALVALADAIAAEARYGSVSAVDRLEAVSRRLRGADVEDHGATTAISAWAGGTDRLSDIVSFGEPLAFAKDPVQGSLFGETIAPRPPRTFSDGPFDLVVAQVGRRTLDLRQRARIRGRFDSVSGAFSVEIPFIDRLFDLVTTEGIVAVRVRAAIFRREFGRALVESIAERARVIAVERRGEDVLVCLRLGGERQTATLLRALGSRDAAQIMEQIKTNTAGELVDLLATPIGPTSVLGADEVWEVPHWMQRRVPHMPLVRGGDVASWTILPSRIVVWPYDEHGLSMTPPPRPVVEWLSRFRRVLESRRSFGKTPSELGRRWYEYLEHHRDRWSARPAVIMARRGTHSRVAVSRKPAVVGAGAYALHPTDPEDVFLIAGLLGSRVGTFWLKQTFFVYQTERGLTFEATATGLRSFPRPLEHLAAIRAAAGSLDRIARSARPIASVIEGDPARLEERIAAHLEAQTRISTDLANAQGELDRVVSRAFGLDPDWAADFVEDEVAIAFDGPAEVDSALKMWLMDFIHEGFVRGELPADRPVGADEVEDWLRIGPLARVVLRRLELRAVDLLLEGSVPLEPEFVFSASGLEKLKAWAGGSPKLFQSQDYASATTRFPGVSASRHRRRIWHWRGRYNVPGERFLHLVELSETLGRPFFGWCGATEGQRRRLVERASTEPDAQVDLERLLQLQTLVSTRERLTIGELADELFATGWSYREVELGLQVLERAGAVGVKRRFDA